jgi:hypothetical protein
LVWSGSEWVALLGTSSLAPVAQSLFTAIRLPAGGGLGGLQIMPNLLFGDTELRTVPAGVIVARADSDEVFLFSRGPNNADTIGDVLLSIDGRVSPSGRLIARVSPDGRMQVQDLARPDQLPAETDRGPCLELVAWSQRLPDTGLERIACRADTQLTVFDYSDPPPGEDFDAQRSLRLSRQFSFQPSFTNARRAFTHSGRWLMLEAPGRSFSSVDLAPTEPSPVVLYVGGDVEMQLAPSRDFVVFSGADALLEYGLPRDTHEFRNFENHGGTPDSFLLCEEGRLGSWCGAPRAPNHISYSSDSGSLLFEGPAGVLWLADVTGFPASKTRSLTTLTATCSVNCVGDAYAFTP